MNPRPTHQARGCKGSRDSSAGLTYESACAYLLGTVPEAASRHQPSRLVRMRALLAELGNPQDAYPTVHVGGTSGKGSTATMIAAALSAAGKRTGLHTKPHLRSVTERARIDGVDIPQDAFGVLLSEMLPMLERTTLAHGRPSYYETLLALAFKYFALERVDIAVIEVGIGGMLDGTNVLLPRVCVITSVGLDHTEVLGETIAKIAADKAGIAKPNVPMVIGAQDPTARAVITEACARVGAPVVMVDTYAHISESGQSFQVQTKKATYHCRLPILGAFQRKNAASAIVALEHLGDDLCPTIEAIERGFAQVALPGRMEYLCGRPGVVFDIAHNPDKAGRLAESLIQSFGACGFIFVIAVSEGKDAPGVLAPLLALEASFICTGFTLPGRTAVPPERLVALLEAAGASARAIADPIEALAVARYGAAASNIVVVTGSTFVVAQLREWWFAHAH